MILRRNGEMQIGDLEGDVNMWTQEIETAVENTGSSKKMDEILNRYNLKSNGRIYTFGVLRCSEKFKVLD